MSEAAESGGNGPAWRKVTLAPGLYLVATPIGAARDITLRALDILASADVIAAEDTRTARRLMELHGVPLAGRPLIAYHDHNGAARRPDLLARLEAGASLAYVSEAGTPLVADPGYQLGRAAAEAGADVFAAPGPSAALAALTVSGLPSDHFAFLGFPPTKGAAKGKFFDKIAKSEGTCIIFEAPGRVRETLYKLCERCEESREAALCRELTKRFEEVRRGSLAVLLASVEEDPPRGECVLVIGRAPEAEVDEGALEEALRLALAQGSARDAASEVAEAFGRPRREVYQMALRLKAEE